MTCTEIREIFVEYLEGLLSAEQKQKFESHLENCPQCKMELESLRALNQRFFADAENSQQKNFKSEVMNKIICEQNKKLRQTAGINRRFEIVRKIMKSRITKFAVAAVILIAASLGITFLNKSTPVAYANQILTDAVKAVSDLTSVHMKARMRTLEGDNFGLIGLEFDFVPIEMWKRTEPNGLLQWRVEKPKRVLLMDGQSTLMLMGTNHGVRADKPYPLGCFDSWFARLLDVQGLLDSELHNAKNNSNNEAALHHETINGKDKIILEVESTTDVPENDYMRNKFIFDSDHLKVYQFDSETKLLESFQIYVHTGSNDILIFEITNIEYNQPISDSVFKVDLPENMIWYETPKVLPDNEKYQKMSPKEAAQAFFEACAKEDWNECLKFEAKSSVDERTKKYLGGLEIINIGEPFKSGGYGGWFVPYEIKFKPNEINIRLSNANSAGRFVITGQCDNNLQNCEDANWTNTPEIPADNAAYVKMTPEEVVKAYYVALSNLDWDKMKKFMPGDEIDKMKTQCEAATKYGIKTEDLQKMMPKVEVVKGSWSQDKSVYIVTCRESRIKKFNLAIRNDNPAKRWVVDGGL
jgi:outer membrane lipoprotein-sorting protein